MCKGKKVWGWALCLLRIIKIDRIAEKRRKILRFFLGIGWEHLECTCNAFKNLVKLPLLVLT